MGLTACRSVPLHLLLYPSCRVCQGGERWENGLPRQSVPQGHLLRGADWLAMTRCVGDGVLQWSAAEQMPLGYDVPHKTCRGERPCPPRMTATPCRAGPACPDGSNAYFAAGHMGPALRDLRLTHPPSSAKRTQIVNKCPLTALSYTKEFPFHSSNYTAARYVNYNKCVVSFINRVYRRFFHIARRNSKGT